MQNKADIIAEIINRLRSVPDTLFKHGSILGDLTDGKKLVVVFMDGNQISADPELGSNPRLYFLKHACPIGLAAIANNEAAAVAALQVLKTNILLALMIDDHLSGLAEFFTLTNVEDEVSMNANETQYIAEVSFNLEFEYISTNLL